MRVIRNPKANPKSKTQIAKAKYLKEHPVQFVKCEKCGNKHATLFKVNGKYFCELCKGAHA